MAENKALTHDEYLALETQMRCLSDYALIQLRYIIDREFRRRELVSPLDNHEE